MFAIVLLVCAAAYIHHERRRDTYEVQGRDTEIVIVGERPETAGCLHDSVIQEFQAVCDANSFCSGNTCECKMAIAPCYQKMLDMAPAATHFVHLQHTPRKMRAVVLLWGLTDESLALCTQMANQFGTRMGEQFRLQCI